MAKSPEHTALLAGHESHPDGPSDTITHGRERETPEVLSPKPADGPNHTVGFARGLVVGASLFVLIFIHCTQQQQTPRHDPFHLKSSPSPISTILYMYRR
jgi:hypothetical protein